MKDMDEKMKIAIVQHDIVAESVERTLSGIESLLAGVEAVDLVVLPEMRKEIDNLRDDIENLAQGQPRQNIGTIKNLQKNFAPQAMLPQHALPASQPNETEFINAEPHDDATMTLEDTERETIRRSLERNEGKRKKTAEELKISERTLYRKIKEYGLE